MNAELIGEFLKARLQTTEQMQNAADLIGVSLATMYRYRATPDAIPLGKLSVLASNFGVPFEGTAAWSKADVVQGERRRFELEQKIAMDKGTRFAVTPAFSVNCELTEVTNYLWERDYPIGNVGGREVYADLRQKRREVYLRGDYRSYELIIASCYRDFYRREGRFRGIPENLWANQHRAIVNSNELGHVNRRVYTPNTPELPVFTCYSNQTAVIRVDDFTVEFGGAQVVNELTAIFKAYFEAAEIRTKPEVHQFLENPTIQ